MSKETEPVNTGEIYLRLFQLLELIGIYCPNKLVTANGKRLCSFDSKTVWTIVPDLFRKVVSRPGELRDEDEYLDFERQKKFFEEIAKKGKILRLNHVGFCYPAVSSQAEKEALLAEAGLNNLGLYEIPSNDFSSWWFIGDLTDWRDPMIEIMPVEGEIADKEIGWWLPHIHVDIDTDLSFADLKQVNNRTFQGARRITPLVYGGFVTQVRVWQGVIAGVNIHLDLGTSARNTRYVRKVMMMKC